MTPEPTPPPPAAASQSELLLLPDGRILVHNLTEPVAELLHDLSPDNRALSARTRVAAAAIAADPPTSEVQP